MLMKCNAAHLDNQPPIISERSADHVAAAAHKSEETRSSSPSQPLRRTRGRQNLKSDGILPSTMLRRNTAGAASAPQLDYDFIPILFPVLQEFLNYSGPEDEKEELRRSLLRRLKDKGNVKQAEALEGTDAQSFQDILDRISSSELRESELSLACQRWIQSIAKTSGKIPGSLFITNITQRTDFPITGGGFADIYLGLWHNEKVAIKALRIFAHGQEADIIHRDCYKEAIVWSKLSHPRILPFLGISKEVFERRICFVSPWMEHGNIREYLRNQNHPRHPLPLLHEVSQGLEYLHSIHFVHGDIKSGNILINDNGECQLCDMGLTTLSVSQAYTASRQSTSSGTVRWMAPELFADESRVSRETDVYAFGMTIYEVLSGFIPFHDLKEFPAIQAIVGNVRPQRPPPEESLYEISNPIWELIQGCWFEDPTRRYEMRQVVILLSEGASQ